MWDFFCKMRRTAWMRCLCANKGRMPEPALWGTLCPTWAQSITTVFSSVKIKSYCPGHQSWEVWPQTYTAHSPFPSGRGRPGTLHSAPSYLAPGYPEPGRGGHTCLTHTRLHTRGECSVHTRTRRQAHACARVHPHTCTYVHTEALLEKSLSPHSEARNLPASWYEEFAGKSEWAEHRREPGAGFSLFRCLDPCIPRTSGRGLWTQLESWESKERLSQVHLEFRSHGAQPPTSKQPVGKQEAES